MVTATEEEALRAYAGDAYRAINAHLRGLEDGDATTLSWIATLAQAMTKAGPVTPPFLFRGYDGDVVAALRSSGLTIGSV